MLKWLHKVSGSIASTPGIDSDGAIYVATENTVVEGDSGIVVGGVSGVSGVSAGKLSVLAITPASLPAARVKVENFTTLAAQLSAPSASVSASSWTCSVDSRNTQKNRGSSVEKCRRPSVAEPSETIVAERKLSNKISEYSADVSANGNRNSKDKERKKPKKDEAPLYSCLPGLAEYMGVGVDITLQRDDPKFTTTRIYEFSCLKRIQNLHGYDHLSPPLEKLSVSVLDEMETSNPFYSGVFTGVRPYTLRQSLSYFNNKMNPNYNPNYDSNSNTNTNINLNPSLMDSTLYPNFIWGKIPLGTVSSILANSSGSWTTTPEPSMARKISNNAADGRVTLVNTATFSHTKYDILPQPGVGQLCGLSFMRDVEALSDQFEEQEYLSFVKRYGTHIIIGSTFGGSITAESSYDPCSASVKNTKSPEEIGENFKKEIGGFTVYGKQSDITVSGSVIKREEMVVCGGVENDFKRDSKSPFSEWSKGTLTQGSRLCAVTFSLLPIYATIPVESGKRILIESAVLNYMNQGKNFASLNVTEVTSCKRKTVLTAKTAPAKAVTKRLHKSTLRAHR